MQVHVWVVIFYLTASLLSLLTSGLLLLRVRKRGKAIARIGEVASKINQSLDRLEETVGRLED